MRKPLKVSFALAWGLVAVCARGEVTVTDAWVRGTAPRQTATEVFMKIRSSEELSLINVASPAANIFEIQKPVTSGGEKAMRPVGAAPSKR